jgi:CRISPR system Cascade subunit CasE
MYLSRVFLDPGEPVTRRSDAILRSLYLLHQAVYAAFDPGERGEGRVLYRREPELTRGKVAVLVQSRCRPDWERGFAAKLAEAEAAEVRPLEHQLRTGQWLRFRLRANPTRRTREGKRVALTSLGPHREIAREEMGRLGLLAVNESRVCEFLLEQWLRRHLAGAAADLEFQVTDEGLAEDRPHRLQFRSVRYDGVLQVGNPELLAQRAAGGIGSAKGFGFGLLSLARA